MKVLWISSHLPQPGVSGGRLREWELIARLSKKCNVYLAVASKTYEKDRQNVDQVSNIVTDVWIFQNLVSPPCWPMRQRPMLEVKNTAPELIRWLERFLFDQDVDIVHVENAYIAHHVPAHIKQSLVVAEHNIESLVAISRSRIAATVDDKQFWLREATMLREMERKARLRASKVVVVSQADREKVLTLDHLPPKKVSVVPNGISSEISVDSVEYLKAKKLKSDLGIPIAVFGANFAYDPNLDALEFLLKEIMPLVMAKGSRIGLWIVGNSLPQWLKHIGGCRDTMFVGRVKCMRAWLAAADFVIVPLRFGGGTKIKVLEAIEVGQAIVSTSIGVEGIPIESGDILVTDNAEEFAEYMIDLAHDYSKVMELRLRTQRLRKRLPTWEDSAATLMEIYDELIFSRRR